MKVHLFYAGLAILLAGIFTNKGIALIAGGVIMYNTYEA